MEAAALIRKSLEMGYSILDQTMADCPPDIRSRRLEGATLGPIDAILAHLVCTEDDIVQGTIRQQPTVFERDGWAARFGVDAPAALVEGAPYAHDTFDEYTGAVRAATLEFLSSADETALSRQVSEFGGGMSALEMLSIVVLAHVHQHTGEIAALKGVMGLKGLPF